MKAYLDLVNRVLSEGVPRPNRTGERTLGVFGGEFVHDMRSGFPLLTTKRVNIAAVISELLGFIAGVDSAADFRRFGTKIWDGNANAPGRPDAPNSWLTNPNRRGPDDLGRIYGVQWRHWRDTITIPDVLSGDALIDTIANLQAQGYDVESYAVAPGGLKHVVVAYREIDQLQQLVDGLRSDPYGRRHIVNAWNVSDLDKMALPPCHTMFQCYVEPPAEPTDQPTLHLQMYQRSADLFLGVPFNIASYALLLKMLAHVTHYRTGTLRITFGDLHIYESHIPEMLMQIRREPSTLPTMRLVVYDPSRDNLPSDDGMRVANHLELLSLDEFTAENFKLLNYTPQAALQGKMAV